jgi:hypothetical protein
VDGLRLTVRLGPDTGELDQVLDVELVDVVRALAVTDAPLSWMWALPGGGIAELVITVHT